MVRILVKTVGLSDLPTLNLFYAYNQSPAKWGKFQKSGVDWQSFAVFLQCFSLKQGEGANILAYVFCGYEKKQYVLPRPLPLILPIPLRERMQFSVKIRQISEKLKV